MFCFEQLICRIFAICAQKKVFLQGRARVFYLFIFFFKMNDLKKKGRPKQLQKTFVKSKKIMTCAARDCNSIRVEGEEPKLDFFTLPSSNSNANWAIRRNSNGKFECINIKTRAKWLARLGICEGERNSKYAKVCSKHFSPTDIYVRGNKKLLHKGTLPLPWNQILPEVIFVDDMLEVDDEERAQESKDIFSEIEVIEIEE